ncbi:FkbM family methyltransferase [Roseomonas rosulenta]|uniref:FkbM family methyltransferase n=1 Tax=Roseomonas rosulenta TaxID=2748667 RepID=UPI0018E01CA8|nr:FkbM family methyltransferase [Roseomonas rosulenta]
MSYPQSIHSLVPLVGATEELVPEIPMEALLESVEIIRRTHFTTTGVHDVDFEFFRNLGADKVFCDVGANIGNSINSLTSVGSRAAIHSFEINPVLYRSINEAMELYPGPSMLHRFGLASEEGSFWLFIPYCSGIFILGEATIRLEHSLKPESLARLRSYTTDGYVAVGKVKVFVKRFDDLGILPDYVKIDVEGAESRVLSGMWRSIGASRPIILIENSFQDEIDVLMRDAGYSPWGFHPSERRLLPRPKDGFQNTFYVSDDRVSRLQMEGTVGPA